MENKQNYYSNFKCYDSKGKRLAVFGMINGNSLHIYSNKCSKKDQFSKKLSKSIMDTYLNGDYTMQSQRFIIIVNEKKYKLYYNNTLTIENDRPEWLLNEYCKNNFYHKQTITCLYNVEMLKKGFEMKIVNVTKKKVKI